jgi:hypothetical protein
MPGLSDTDPEVSQAHLELLRSAPPAKRLALARSLSRTVVGMARERIARAMPGASPQEIDLRLVRELYGPELAEGVRADLAGRER